MFLTHLIGTQRYVLYFIVESTVGQNSMLWVKKNLKTCMYPFHKIKRPQFYNTIILNY